jgi:putative ABC transport system permease protein
MGTALKLAFRNLVRAKLRTWLSVGVLSFVFVASVAHMAIFSGMHTAALRSAIAEDAAGGHYRHEHFRPEDPLSRDLAWGPLPAPLAEAVDRKDAAVGLVHDGTIAPGGRLIPVTIRGIDPAQAVREMPSAALAEVDEDEEDFLPVMLGPVMARSKVLEVGDTFLLRWRDEAGTFDAVEARVAVIMSTMVASIDDGQVWVPLDRMREMLRLEESVASYVVMKEPPSRPEAFEGWRFESQDDLVGYIKANFEQIRAGAAMMYVMMLGLLLLTVFDAQVLSIFRRKKEIGTLMALGLTRVRVVGLFTLEGVMIGLLGLGVGLVYGIPLWIVSAHLGLPLGELGQEQGLPIPDVVYPDYSVLLVAGTSVIVLFAVALISYLPSRRIARLRPTDALRGNT